MSEQEILDAEESHFMDAAPAAQPAPGRWRIQQYPDNLGTFYLPYKDGYGFINSDYLNSLEAERDALREFQMLLYEVMQEGADDTWHSRVQAAQDALDAAQKEGQ